MVAFKKVKSGFYLLFFAYISAVCISGCGTDEEVWLQAVQDAEPSEEQTVQATEETDVLPDFCYVHVCGAVCRPGVYKLSFGSRIYEAIEMAGGLTEDAAADAVNQAETVADGQMIRIPTLSEQPEAGEDVVFALETSDGRIDLNTASEAELMTLPGIGASKAADIIAYREKSGGFSAVEDIMKVNGIKEGVYNRIKELVKV